MAFMNGGKQGAFGNPFIKKVAKEEYTQGACATYRGIIGKSAYFMGLVIAGVVLALVLGTLSLSTLYVTAAIAGITFLVCPFITIFARKTTPVTGSLTFLATGILLGLMGALSSEYKSFLLLAAVITVLLVISLQCLFAAGVIRVNAKLRSVVCACLLTMLLTGLMLAIFAFIPALRHVYITVATNPVICIAVSLIYIVLACMCLLSDFYTVQSVVEGGLNKSCEWFVAYSLSYTVVWLFMEILDLILTIKRITDD